MTTKNKIKAVTPRLSDEDPDPIEQDDAPDGFHLLQEGWLPWDNNDIIDIKRLIDTKMAIKQRYVLTAFLNGHMYYDVGVTEKYWRYHFNKGIEFIKKELKL